jgi:chemotaxis-related protein WspB
MSMLLFYVGENRYAIETYSIARIVPHVSLKPIPFASPYVAGGFNLGTKPIPVIDFCQLIEGRRASTSFHTRIIVLENLIEQKKEEQFIGLLGERVTEIIDLDKSQFITAGFYCHFPYLGGVYTDHKGGIHLIKVDQLFEFLKTVLLGITQAEIKNDQHSI